MIIVVASVIFQFGIGFVLGWWVKPAIKLVLLVGGCVLLIAALILSTGLMKPNYFILDMQWETFKVVLLDSIEAVIIWSFNNVINLLAYLAGIYAGKKYAASGKTLRVTLK
mgnify:CR=1 FL=1